MARQSFKENVFTPSQRPVPNSNSLLAKENRAATMLRTSKIDKGYELLHIPKGKIRTNKKNDFPISEIENLKKTIFEDGILQPLHGRYIEDDDEYWLNGGERRFTALCSLMDDYKDWLTKEDDGSIEYLRFQRHVKPFILYGLPFHKDDEFSEDDLKRLGAEESLDSLKELNDLENDIKLDISNITQREMDPFTRARATKRLADNYRRRNELLGDSEKIANINNAVAEELGITPKQVITQKNYASLLPELQELIEKKGLPLTYGASLHKLDEEMQRFLIELLSSSDEKSKYSAEEVELMYSKLTSMEQENTKNAATVSQLTQQLKNAHQQISDLNKQEKEVIKVLPKQAKILKLEANLSICISNASQVTTALKNALGSYMENVNDDIVKEYGVMSPDEVYQKIDTILSTYNAIIDGDE